MTTFNPHEYLNSFTNFESQLQKLRPEDFNLHRIEKFLDKAGIHTQDLKVVHVAGTKGKGSTCAILACILQEAGYKVGLYTSPHLHHVNERIRVLRPDGPDIKDGFSGSISDDDLAVVLSALRPFAAAIINEGIILTYFEVLTVAALFYFVKSNVDIIILETGLGGRLDATNAVDSLIAVITQISLDHTRILGPTISKIAFEKAGIIKNTRQKVVIAPQEKQAMDVILGRCREFGVQPVLVIPEKNKNLKVGLKGKHQLINAATAVEVVGILKSLGFKVTDEALVRGLKNVRWPGRFEIIGQRPEVVVDAAHNVASAQALAETLAECYHNRRVLLVLGVSTDKDIAGICHSLKDVPSYIVLTKAAHPRAHSFSQAEGREYFQDRPFEIIDHLEQALMKAFKIAGPKDVVVVTGSIFVAAQARTGIMHVPV